jgi:hypothetical protein
MLQQKTSVIDFNSRLSCGDSLQSLIRRTQTNEFRAYNFFANPGFYPTASVQSLRQSLQWQSSCQIILMFRSIFNNGFRAADISRQFERCRNLFASSTRQALSLRISRKNLSKYFGRCKRKKKLANISRFCTSSDHQSQTTLRGRRLWNHIKKYRLCLRRNCDRLMPVTVSMGSAPQTQKCRKAAYVNGPQRLYTYFYTHYKRCCARNNCFSNYAFGTAGHLCHGQRLHGFCHLIQFFKEPLLLCHSGKEQYRLLSQVLSPRRQKHRLTIRSNNQIDRAENVTTLSDTTKTNQLSRRRAATYFCFSDKQFSVRCFDSVPTIPTAMADRTVLQMDQAALANKIFLWHFCQRCQDSNLDSDKCLCACSNHPKRAEIGTFTTRNTPNPQHFTFRENTVKTSIYERLLYY